MEEHDNENRVAKPLKRITRSRLFQCALNEVKRSSIPILSYENEVLNSTLVKDEKEVILSNGKKDESLEIAQHIMRSVPRDIQNTCKSNRNYNEFPKKYSLGSNSRNLQNNYQTDDNCNTNNVNEIDEMRLDINYKGAVFQNCGVDGKISSHSTYDRFVNRNQERTVESESLNSFKSSERHYENYLVYEKPEHNFFSNRDSDSQFVKNCKKYESSLPNYSKMSSKSFPVACSKLNNEEDKLLNPKFYKLIEEERFKDCNKINMYSSYAEYIKLSNHDSIKLPGKESVVNDCKEINVCKNYDSELGHNLIVFNNEMCHPQNNLDLDIHPEYSHFHGIGQTTHTSEQSRGLELFSELNRNVDSVFINPFINEYTEVNVNAKLLLQSTEEFIPPPTSYVQDSFSDYHASMELLRSSNSSQPNSNSDSSSTNESCSTYELGPDHLEAITQYILKVVKEQMVDNELAYKVVHDINALFRVHLIDSVIEVYGSYYTNLAITTSDINLVMKSSVNLRRNFMHSVYDIISEELNSYTGCVIQDARFATDIKIHFTEPEKYITCTLAYFGKYPSGLFKMGNFLKLVCSQDKRVRPLIIAAKVWAEVCHINNVKDGQLHSIGFTLMMIHFLQQCENPVLPIFNSTHDKIVRPSDASIGELWLGFLKYYGFIFNWKENVVTVTSKECVSKKSVGWEHFWMAIENPRSPKNIAQSVVKSDTADYIKACFQAHYEYFATPLLNMNTNDFMVLSNKDPNYEYSFEQCYVNDGNDFCEMCEDDECQNKISKDTLIKVSKMTDGFLKSIRNTLYAMYEKYTLTSDEVKDREDFVNNLEMDIRGLKGYQDVELKLYGSSINGFGFKSSDLDICAVFKIEIKDKIRLLLDLSSFLRKKCGFQNVFSLIDGKVPILKFYYSPKKWRVDLSLNNHLAMHNSNLLYTYGMIDERCKILGCCLKLLAKKAVIAETNDRALSSYSYLLMVIHFLQQTEPPVLPILQDNKLRGEDYGLDSIVDGCNVWFCKDLDYIKKIYPIKNYAPVEQLWLDLLQYYCAIDLRNFISIRLKEPMYIKVNQNSANLFNIEDPFIATKNLGCSVSRKMACKIAYIFRRAWKTFRTPIEDIPSSVQDCEDLFFSTKNLTGKVSKEVYCNLCGKFGHEKKDCTLTV